MWFQDDIEVHLQSLLYQGSVPVVCVFIYGAFCVVRVVGNDGVKYGIGSSDGNCDNGPVRW